MLSHSLEKYSRDQPRLYDPTFAEAPLLRKRCSLRPSPGKPDKKIRIFQNIGEFTDINNYV